MGLKLVGIKLQYLKKSVLNMLLFSEGCSISGDLEIYFVRKEL